jgi:hypothetical protein
MDGTLPAMERRLQDRFSNLVRQHMDAAQAVAAGIHSLPRVGTSFACTQGAWRFFGNPNVTLPALVEPLRDVGVNAVAASSSNYALMIHDWSKLSYLDHKSKKDQTRLSNSDDIGYEIYVALMADAADGSPLAPMEVELLSRKGVHTTRSEKLEKRKHHLDQILPMMQASRSWNLSKRVVHVIDREADALHHFRQWSADNQLFLVRCDESRKVLFEGSRIGLPAVVETLRSRQEFLRTREVEIRGVKGVHYVAEATVVLEGAARVRKKKVRKKIPGPPITLRLVVAQVRDSSGKMLAEWTLLTNVPADVLAGEIAQWYYWRWRIESYFKLLKSGGMQLEHWQQETAEAIVRRLLVASMACVTIWQLQRDQSPTAVECKKILVRLSGRQTKRKKPATASALLAGMHALLTMLDLLEEYTAHELRMILNETLPFLARSD